MKRVEVEPVPSPPPHQAEPESGGVGDIMTNDSAADEPESGSALMTNDSAVGEPESRSAVISDK